jgi:diketogulonate reductase-like aldo/keto reductase
LNLAVISHARSWPLLLDTAQMYKNEYEAGIAIRNSGLKREEIYVTTKYSATDGLDVQTSIRNSLKYVSTTTPSAMLYNINDRFCSLV